MIFCKQQFKCISYNIKWICSSFRYNVYEICNNMIYFYIIFFQYFLFNYGFPCNSNQSRITSDHLWASWKFLWVLELCDNFLLFIYSCIYFYLCWCSGFVRVVSFYFYAILCIIFHIKNMQAQILDMLLIVHEILLGCMWCFVAALK